MDALVLVTIMAASLTLALTSARVVLVAVLHVMAHPPAPVRIHWGRVVFAVALFWFWYLAPALAAKIPVGIVKSVLAP